MDGRDLWPSTDPLGEALHALRMDGAFYCRSELSAPWGMTLPPMAGCLWFHVVVAGFCWLETSGAGEPRLLRAGDIALVPHGEGHRFFSQPGAPAPMILDLDRIAVSDRYEILRHGGGGDGVTMICGAVTFEHPAARSLVAVLPELIHVEAFGPHQSDWIQSTLRLIAAEARELRPGGETVITRLADILVVQVIRSWIATDPAARTGWLGALRDGRVGQALALIHREPARAWSVATLADAVAMSRSAFSARFTALVGEPVMQYVTRWRMQVAVDALAAGDASVAEVALRLGYQSEATFSRAFTRVTGRRPGAVRRRTRPGGPSVERQPAGPAESLGQHAAVTGGGV